MVEINECCNAMLTTWLGLVTMKWDRSQRWVLQENNNSVDFDVSGYAASLGVPALTCGSTLEEVLTSRWCLPSLTLADIRSSTTDDYAKRFGPTRFSVVPHFAQVSIRSTV